MLTSARIYFQPYNNVEVVSYVTIVCVVMSVVFQFYFSLPTFSLMSFAFVSCQAPVLKIRLSELSFVMKRRYMLRHVVGTLLSMFVYMYICVFVWYCAVASVCSQCTQGLELFSSGGTTIFLVLRSVQERNVLFDHIMRLHPSAKFGENELVEMTHLWQTRHISNFDYLMLLNL